MLAKLGEAVANRLLGKVDKNPTMIDWQMIQLMAFGTAIFAGYMLWRKEKREEEIVQSRGGEK